MDSDEARQAVLDVLRRQGRAKNSEILRVIGGDETLLEQVREALIFSNLAEDKKGVGLVYIGPPADAKTDPAIIPATEAESPAVEADLAPAPAEEETPRLRVFLSYGHDENVPLARQLTRDLKARGHEVWLDEEQLQPGFDWERHIEEGLEWTAAAGSSGRVVLLMTPHAVRRPDGYCLNEISRALERGLPVVPVMVVWCEPPLSICRIQWLDMTDCVPVANRQAHYECKARRLIEALEQGRIDFEGTQQRLLNLLQPLPFDSEIGQHLERFTGRQWVFDKIDSWLGDPQASRVFWITGDPGVGKTAIAAWLCEHRQEIVAFHLCRHGHVEKSDPRRCVLSLAYQLSTQLHEYQERLAGLPLEQIVAESDARTLFDRLIVQPLSQSFPRPDGTAVLLIDGLDEATHDGRNELTAFIATEFRLTPEWLRLIITSRPDPEVTHPLQGYTPHVLNASSPNNLVDIRAYLRRELRPFVGGEVPEATIETILERSEGIFLYVDYLRREVAEGRLSMTRPDEFPRGLGEVYAQFVARQFPDSAAYRQNIAPALDAIAAAREPLELVMVAGMFGWDERRANQFRRSLGSLFMFNAPGSRILPFHNSVLEWMTDANKAGEYFVSVQGGHKRLADCGWSEHQEGVRNLSPYMFRHLSAHLAEAGRWDDVLTVIRDPELGLLDRWIERGQVQEGLRCLTGVIEHLRQCRRESGTAAWLATQVARIHAGIGQYDEAEAWLKNSLAWGTPSRNWRVRLVAYHELGSLCLYRGDFAGAERAYHRALRMARLGFGRHRDEVAANLLGLAVIALEQSNYSRAIRLARRALRLARRSQDSRHVIAANSLLATALSDDERYEEANAHLNAAAFLAEVSDMTTARADLDMIRGWMRYNRAVLNGEEPSEAATLFRRALEQARAAQLWLLSTEARLGLAWCALARGDADEASRRLDEVQGRSRPDILAVGRAAVTQQRGDLDAARRLYETAISLAHQYSGGNCEASALVGLGATHWHQGAFLEAETCWQKAERLATRRSRVRRRLVQIGIRRARTDSGFTPGV